MAKARAKIARSAKRVSRLKDPRARARRRKVPKKNPRRTTRAKSHLWLVFKCKGKAVYFAVMRGTKQGWSLTRGEAVLFAVKGSALSVARILGETRGLAGWQVGAASSGTTAPQIAAKCKAGN